MIMNPFQTDPVESTMVATLREFEKILGKGVAGEKVVVGDTTIIPLYVTSFGIGMGGGSMFGEPVGGGGGGGMIPCALVIVGPDGVRVEHLHDQMTTTASNAQTALAMAMADQGRGRKSATTTTEQKTEQQTQAVVTETASVPD